MRHGYLAKAIVIGTLVASCYAFLPPGLREGAIHVGIPVYSGIESPSFEIEDKEEIEIFKLKISGLKEIEAVSLPNQIAFDFTDLTVAGRPQFGTIWGTGLVTIATIENGKEQTKYYRDTGRQFEFWLAQVASSKTFDPMHAAYMKGMLSRVYGIAYSPEKTQKPAPAPLKTYPGSTVEQLHPRESGTAEKLPEIRDGGRNDGRESTSLPSHNGDNWKKIVIIAVIMIVVILLAVFAILRLKGRNKR